MNLFMTFLILLCSKVVHAGSFMQEKPAVEAFCNNLVKTNSRNGRFDASIIKLTEASAKRLKRPSYVLTCLMVGQFETDFNALHRLEFESLLKREIDLARRAKLLDELSELVFLDEDKTHIKALTSGPHFSIYYEEKVKSLKKMLAVKKP